MVLWSTLTPRLRVNTGRNTVIPTVAVSFSVRMTCRGCGDLRVLVVLRPWHRDFVSVGWHFLAGRPVLPPPDEIVRGGVALAAGRAGRAGPPGSAPCGFRPGPPVRGPGVRRQRRPARPGLRCFTGGLRPGGLGAAGPGRAVP